ncbi:MAG: hypothetical protein J7L71_06010 [Spirochaetaceae bacterium]|nr:hypothetical protein [Spirochaetaceae bacterium]
MKLKVKLSILILLFLFLGSCNLFFSSPHGRENLDDEAAQITAFTAVPSSDKSVVTMWNWREPPNWSNDDRITEIQIQHSIFGYPENYVFFAGERFTDNSTWQHEWKDLIPGITHYFSIFALSTNGDGNDIRYAPIKAKVKLPGTAETGLSYPLLQTLNVDNAGGTNIDFDPITIGNSQWAILYFDLPENILVTDSSINVSITFAPTLTEITFAALDGSIPTSGMDIWFQLQDGSIVNESAVKTFNVAQASYNITEVIRAAVLGPEKAILIKTTDGSGFTISNNVPAPNITTDIIK